MSIVAGLSGEGQLEGLRENLSLINSGIDWQETGEAHVLRAEFQGLRKEELKVEVEADGVLQISGEKGVEQVERTTGKFVRRFKLPDNANADQVNSSMDHGVLTVTVPKMQPQLHDATAAENLLPHEFLMFLAR